MITKKGREIYGFEKPRIQVRAHGVNTFMVDAAKAEGEKDDIFIVEMPDQWGKINLKPVWGGYMTEFRDDFVAVVFDTETDGLPKSFSANSVNFENWPHIVEITAIALRFTRGDDFPEEIGRIDSVIYPEGFEIPENIARIHGITTEKARAEGRPILEVLKEFEKMIEGADAIVAHNLDFDIRVTEAAFYREGLTPYLATLLPLCTMKTTVSLLKLPSSRGGYKWPKLNELHSHLFGFEFEGAHRSAQDTEALASCFTELMARKHFNHKFFKDL